MPDLFSAVADHASRRGAAHLTSVQPSAAVVSAADTSAPRYVLPTDLSNALQQLDDLELDRLVAASRRELQRRGRPVITPEIRPAPHINASERVAKASIAKDQLSERQQLPEPNGALTQGQVNAVLATFRAGIAPARIARQFGISQSDVRKVLALESRSFGKRR
jgi:DNA-binding NarL/FixJ family response regulator